MRMWIVMAMGLLMMGCASHGTRYENGLMIRSAGETNMFRPSLSVLEVRSCRGAIEMVEEQEVCRGDYGEPMWVHASQSGALTGLGGAVVQAGAVVGASYLLADGIRDSASEVNQTGGGASQQQNQGQAQKQRQQQGQKQKTVPPPKPHR